LITLNDFIEEQLQDPVFKAKYDALEPEFSVMQAMLDAEKDNKFISVQESIAGSV